MTLFEKSTSMQIIPFPTHYQSVYTNFDISSFSLISWILKAMLLQLKTYAFATQNLCFLIFKADICPNKRKIFAIWRKLFVTKKEK